MCLKAKSEGKNIFKDSLLESHELNREHFVCYVRSPVPGVDVAFIAGAWNFPVCSSKDLDRVLPELIYGLYDYCFEVRALTCDNAQSNEGFLKHNATRKVSEFLPGPWIEEYGIDGSFLIGMDHPITRNAIFYISDPPHCVKRLAAAVRNRNLQYERCPMTSKLLFDVWQAVEFANGCDASLMAEHKFKITDFVDANAFSAICC